MDERLIADLIAILLMTFCLGTVIFTLVKKWRQAKCAGEKPLVAAWPYGLAVVTVILLMLPQVAHFFLGPLKTFSRIITGISVLLTSMVAITILKQRWQRDGMNGVDHK
jgi:protein-S-isoprenylcysteine O-methyltransferase Ste14